VNNALVTDSSVLGYATIISDYGALVKGSGAYDNPVATRNGGRFQTGNSPGRATIGSFEFGDGGVNDYLFEIDNATGAAGPTPDAAGHVDGWSLVNVMGNFSWTANIDHPLTMNLVTLLNPTTVGTDPVGPMANFDPTRSYSWVAVTWGGSYSGPVDAAALNAATIFDTTGFANSYNGTFSWKLDQSARTLSLVYTPNATT
jgi:hypothetical protein